MLCVTSVQLDELLYAKDVTDDQELLRIKWWTAMCQCPVEKLRLPESVEVDVDAGAPAAAGSVGASKQPGKTPKASGKQPQPRV